MRRRFRVSVPVRLAGVVGAAGLVGSGLAWWFVEARSACAPDCWWLGGWWWTAICSGVFVGALGVCCGLAALARWGAEG